MAKFLNEEAKERFYLELRLSKLDEEGFIKKQRETVDKYNKNFRGTQKAKEVWRRNRTELMRGIKRFHGSTKGKQFHRKLGRFLAMRPDEAFTVEERLSLQVCLSSFLTHINLESNGGEWYKPLNEAIEFEMFRYVAEDFISDIRKKVNSYSPESFSLTEEEQDFLISIVEATALIRSLAKQVGMSEQSVEKRWKEAKEIVKKEYNLKENSKRFWPLVVGVLKKMLGLDSKD